MSRRALKAAIFDLDGVFTAWSQAHSEAWKTMLDTFLKKYSEKQGVEFREFTTGDYLKYVEGKPRIKGVESFLKSRKIVLPLGEAADTFSKGTIYGLGNRKNKIYLDTLKKGGIAKYSSTIIFLKRLKKMGIKAGVVSSNRNCKFLLETEGLDSLFDTRVDGRSIDKHSLKGKPEPDMFLRAVNNLKINPSEALAVEDDVSGVESALRANCGLVIGIAQTADEESFLRSGADIVVGDMREITISDVYKWFRTGISEDGWLLTYREFLPENEKHREVLTATGNGYFCARGSAVNSSASDIHYPGMYITGLYNELTSIIDGRQIKNNDRVNCPNWLKMEFKIGRDGFLDPLKQRIIKYRHILNMKEAYVKRSITFEDTRGRITTVESYVFASMFNPHYGALRYRIIPENYSEKIIIRSTIDGNIVNSGVDRYKDLSCRHLKPVTAGQGKTPDEVYLHMQTTNSKVDIYINARVEVFCGKDPVEVSKQVYGIDGQISEVFELSAVQNQSYTIDKIVSVFTSKDRSVPAPVTAARNALDNARSFDKMISLHKKAWQDLWRIFDIKIESDRFTQKVIRLHIYHMLLTASPHNIQIDSGLPARGLHGEGYRGHIFWDELFVFPLYNLHIPEITRSLLLYKYRRLDAAREYAVENGYEGALFPWQAADDGSEESQIVHYNPVSDKWDPDLSSRQRHSSIAVAYNVWTYFCHTNDYSFLYEYGAEMFLEIVRCFMSMLKFNKKDHRYHIKGVMGPDEYHEKYENAKTGGLRDNAYTNIMVAWLVRKSLIIIEYIPEKLRERLLRKMEIYPSELLKWRHMAESIHVPIDEKGLISQFDGYMKLKELDWASYIEKYGNIQRMDRILKAEGDTPDRYKLSKQADLLMLFYLLEPSEVKEILAGMGYSVPESFVEINYDFYEPRTTHGSSLSHIVHTDILQYMHSKKEDIWKGFCKALISDIYDTQGGTTKEGIHCGVMSGTISLVISVLAGLKTGESGITVTPNLPKHWKKISFSIFFQNSLYDFEITRRSLKMKIDGEPANNRIKYSNGTYTVIHKV